MHVTFYFRCGGSVYEAEKVTVKDDVYHKVSNSRKKREARKSPTPLPGGVLS